MKPFLPYFLLLCFCTAGHTQPFKKGYFVDNNGSRTECLIKRADWTFNPTQFNFKTDDTDSILTKKTVADVQEMGIYNFVAYKRCVVDIERSDVQTRFLSYDRFPKWEKVTVWLKILEKGDANLYVFVYGNITKYFYDTKDLPAKQLLYLRYLDKSDSETLPGYEESVYEDNEYKRELFKHLKCNAISYKDLADLVYTKKALIPFFKKYNDCMALEKKQ